MNEDSSRKKNLGDLTRIMDKRLRSGISKIKVINEMVGEGLDRITAEDLVNHIDVQVRNEFGQGSTSDLTWGFVVFIVGVGITVSSYRVAGPGGSYFIMWGAIAYGLYRLSGGFYKKVKYSTSPNRRKTWTLWGLAAIVFIVAVGTMITYQIANS